MEKKTPRYAGGSDMAKPLIILEIVALRARKKLSRLQPITKESDHGKKLRAHPLELQISRGLGTKVSAKNNLREIQEGNRRDFTEAMRVQRGRNS